MRKRKKSQLIRALRLAFGWLPRLCESDGSISPTTSLMQAWVLSYRPAVTLSVSRIKFEMSGGGEMKKGNMASKQVFNVSKEQNDPDRNIQARNDLTPHKSRPHAPSTIRKVLKACKNWRLSSWPLNWPLNLNYEMICLLSSMKSKTRNALRAKTLESAIVIITAAWRRQHE